MAVAWDKEKDDGMEVMSKQAGLEVNQFSNLEAYAVHNPHMTQEQWTLNNSQNGYEGVKYQGICGLPRRTFWFIIVLATVVVGAAVGGGVGGSLAVQNAQSKTKSSPSMAVVTPAPSAAATAPLTTSAPFANVATPPSTTPTSILPETYIPPPAASISRIAIACPLSFKIDSFENHGSFRCKDWEDLSGGDISGLVAYSVQHCVDACVTLNRVAGHRRCIAVTVGGWLSEQYKINNGANCWLKGNGTNTGLHDEKFTTARLCTSSDCGEVVEFADPP